MSEIIATIVNCYFHERIQSTRK